MPFSREPEIPEAVEDDAEAVEPAARVKVHVDAALDALPQEYARRLNNVQFFLEQTLSSADRERLRMRHTELYGLYEGIPLTRRDGGYNQVTPDRITIFWGPLVRDFPGEAALAEKVRKTVYHEIGHYFGLTEADLARTSVK